MAILDTLQARRDAAGAGLNDIDGIKCFGPDATFYLFPNVTEVMARKGLTDYDEFRRAALHATGVSFCTRLHFGRALPGETEPVHPLRLLRHRRPRHRRVHGDFQGLV